MCFYSIQLYPFHLEEDSSGIKGRKKHNGLRLEKNTEKSRTQEGLGDFIFCFQKNEKKKIYVYMIIDNCMITV